ncbi:MAG TPA: glycoside hydrolase family 36 protein [Tepidisphaeraceae bacterium]|jgi:alpha-galactosidase|nr:glycoside hydrolase family 36 protein [Tepidisphaeraceae bacterium]
MDTMQILAEYSLGDMVARYFQREGDTGASLCLLPASRVADVVAHREKLTGVEIDHFANKNLPAWRTDSLAHVRLATDDWGGGLTAGMSMRQSRTTQSLRWMSTESDQPTPGVTVITTTLLNDAGIVVLHRLTHRANDPFVTIDTAVRNDGAIEITIDLITSFSLGGMTPFHPEAAPGRLKLHRFRSYWSAEGRPVAQWLEELQLDRSWAGYTVANERFGQVGSMPVRGWFPLAFLEDVEAGVVWGAQVATGASWQIEAYRKDDFVNLSGGLADREFGQWWKTLRSDETFAAPSAFLTVASGGIDQVSQRLTETYRSGREAAPPIERDLPACFNEWCTTWGFPTHDTMTAQVRSAAELGVRYVCIDNGWQRSKAEIGKHAVGDWESAERVFSQGIDAIVSPARDAGVVMGLWFEHEVATPKTSSFLEHADKMLRLDGKIIESSGRRFFDMRRDDVHALLERRVIDLLDQQGFGYLKIDYNATLPYGVDGAESPGEGLRQHIDGVRRFMTRLRNRLPNLVIENCSSGGHRLEHSLMSLASVASGSDAHEGLECPVLAANMHRLMLPEQNLVWATARKSDDLRRIVYRMAATFLGRVCLSGDLTELDAAQRDLVRAGLNFYRACVPLVRHGTTAWHTPQPLSYRQLTGHQLISRTSPGGDEALFVAHRFTGAATDVITLPLAAGWRVAETYHAEPTAPQILQDRLTFSLPPLAAAAVRIVRANATHI